MDNAFRKKREEKLDRLRVERLVNKGKTEALRQRMRLNKDARSKKARNELLRKKRNQKTNETAVPMNVNRSPQRSPTRSPQRSPLKISPTRSPPKSPARSPPKFSMGRSPSSLAQKPVKSSPQRRSTIYTQHNAREKVSSCSRVYAPLQEGSICWFVAIFTTLFFSQYTRIVMKRHARRVLNDPDRRQIAEAVLEITKGYESGRMSQRAISHIKPRQFLADLRKVRSNVFNRRKNNIEEAHYLPYLQAMYGFLKVPHLFLGFVDGKFVYSAFNKDLPLEMSEWVNAVPTLPASGMSVNTNNPEVLIITRDIAENATQAMWDGPRPNIGQIRGFDPREHMERLTYNGKAYVLDSCIIGAELKTAACHVAHAIAGVTCNDYKYVYNGWAARSGDPAMRGASAVVRNMPCAIARYDWPKNKSFCINSKACSFENARPNQIGRELCFNAVQRSSVTYIRADLLKSYRKKLLPYKFQRK